MESGVRHNILRPRRAYAPTQPSPASLSQQSQTNAEPRTATLWQRTHGIAGTDTRVFSVSSSVFVQECLRPSERGKKKQASDIRVPVPWGVALLDGRSKRARSQQALTTTSQSISLQMAVQVSRSCHWWSLQRLHCTGRLAIRIQLKSEGGGARWIKTR